MDQTIYVGHPKEPVAFIKRREIFKYLDEEFFRMYQIYERFEYGFGMPGNKPWDEQPNHIMEILETFKREHKIMTSQPRG